VKDVQTFKSDRGALVMDVRHPPIVIATWFGKASIDTVEAFFHVSMAAYREAIARGTPHVLITDTVDSDMPDAAIRAHIAELTKAQNETLAATADLNYGSYVVISNPIIRGALTAIGWLTGGMDNVNVSSCTEAIARAKEDYEARGGRWPASLTADGYTRPTRPM
jgi:hypothetical protein